MQVYRALIIAAGCCLLGLPARADEAPTGVRLERRVLVKKDHFFLTGGATWLARGDYYNSPGLAASVSYYPIESGGVDLQVAGFFSSMTTGAGEIFTRFQAAPDVQRPVALAMIGWRQSVGYGKLLVGDALGSTIHFDLQVTGHLGGLFTDIATNPAGSIGVAALAQVSRVSVLFDLPFVVSRERDQNRSVAFGVMPMLSVGVSL